MARTTKTLIREWDTFHKNGPWPAEARLNTLLATTAEISDNFGRYRDSVTEIQSLLATAANEGKTFRAIGSRWSLSHIPHSRHYIHENDKLNLKFELDEAALEGSSAPNKLFLFQCGNTIKEIGTYLKSRGFSMQTMGESNGQTIAGTIATGVHGSAWTTGSIQDSVRAIHLITGTSENDSILLQAASSKSVSGRLAERLNTRLVSDDELFYTALVSLGSCGFIMGVVLEAEPLYLLRRYVGSIALNDALELIQSLDFRNAHFKIDTLNNRIHREVDEHGNGIEPVHFKVYVNPYSTRDKPITEIMYKLPYRSNYPNPVELVRLSFPSDTINFLGTIATRHKDAIPRLTTLFASGILPSPKEEPIEGSLNEIFWDSSYTGSVFAFAFGVDHRQAAPALQLFNSVIVNPDYGLLPGAIGIRIVKGSKATLAFTKFPVTCVMELDGLLPDTGSPQRQVAINRLDVFCAEVCKRLMQANIAFTLHWGKNARWDYPNLIHYMYGDAANKWKEQQKALVPEAMRPVFRNKFMEDIFPENPIV
jgi:hypothetical protein